MVFIDTKKTVIIAEACDNHMGSIDTALEMCLQAKLAGADVIKFQHHLPDEEMLPDVPKSDNFDTPLYEFLKKNALSLDDHKKIIFYCKEIKIKYLCTPFSYKAAKEIAKIGVGCFKIGSGEMRDLPSLRGIASLGLPMILSTGMSDFSEIESTYKFLKDKVKHIAFLNCLSEYPPLYEDLNLGFIKKMIEKFPSVVIGHSDHTPDIYTCFAAVTLGAKIIEKHVILDKKIPGPDQSVSIDFSELKNLVDGVRKIELAMGDKKTIHEREEKIRQWAYRSIVSIKDIQPGEKLSESNIWTKRPGTGILAERYDEMIGKTAKKFIKKDQLLKEEDFK